MTRPKQQNATFDGEQATWLSSAKIVGARRLALVFIVALVPRFAITVAGVHELTFDEIGYHTLAVNLVSGNGYSTSTSAPYTPDSSREPLFPAVVAICYTFFGHHPNSVYVLNAILGALAALLASLLVVELFGTSWRGKAVVVGYIIALNPLLIDMTSELLRETLATFLLITALLLLVKALKNPSWWWICMSGLVLGFANLCRSNFLLLPLFLGPLLIWISPLPRRRVAAQVGVWMAVMAMVVMPWMIRNKGASGVFSLSSMVGISLYQLAYPLQPSGGTDPDLREQTRAVVERHRLDITNAGDMVEATDRTLRSARKLGYDYAAVDARMKTVAIENILAHPFGYMYKIGAGFIRRYWLGYPQLWLLGPRWRNQLSQSFFTNLDSGHAALAIFMLVTRAGLGLVLLCMSLVGTVLAWSCSKLSVIITLPIWYTALTTVAAVPGSTRHRAPTEPLIMIILVVVVSEMIARNGRRLSAPTTDTATELDLN